MVSRCKWALGLAMAVFLAACTSVPLSSLAKLGAVDMGRTPLDQLRVAFIAPEIIKVRPGDMVMKVCLKFADGSLDSTRSLTLLEDPSPPPPSVRAMAGPGQIVHIMKLAEADAQAFHNLQNILSANKEAGRPKKGSLEISLGSQACAAGPLQGRFLVSAAIKTAELADYTVLFTNIDLIDMAKQAGEKAEVKPCA